MPTAIENNPSQAFTDAPLALLRRLEWRVRHAVETVLTQARADASAVTAVETLKSHRSRLVGVNRARTNPLPEAEAEAALLQTRLDAAVAGRAEVEHAAAERDARARHYWDTDLALGTAWADPLQTPFDDGPKDKPLAWDVVMVFPPGARWPVDRLPIPALQMFPRDSAGGPGFTVERLTAALAAH